MKLINADTVVHWQTYDDEHETFPEHEGTIAEFLDAMTDEGCPESVNASPSALQEAIRRIEKKVDEVYGYPKTEYAEGYVNACKAAIKMLKSLSPVDTVEVVRCRDCRYWKKDHVLDGYTLFKGHMVCTYAIAHSFVRHPEDFCSKGERKDSDHHEG